MSSLDSKSENEVKKSGSVLDDVSFVLPEENKKDEKEVKTDPPIPFFSVYRYSDKLDYLLLAIGLTLCLVQGGFNSFNFFIFRHLTDALIEGQRGWVTNTFDYDKFYHDSMKAIMMYVTYGAISFSTGFLAMTCWHTLCERNVYKIRLKFFQSVMSQDIQWFDKNKAGTLTTNLSDGIDRIKDGIGDKTGILITYFVQFVGGMIVAFTFSWKLSLVMLGILPFMVLVFGTMGVVSKIFIKREQESNVNAGGVAEEVLNGIRTVMAFNAQEKETNRYNKYLKQIQEAGNKKSIVVALGTGSIFVVIFLAMGIAFWYGTKLYVDGEISSGTIFGVFWAFLVSMFSIAQAGSQIPALLASRTSAGSIFAIIDRVPEIDSNSSSGIIPEVTNGAIEIKNVTFRYPTRPDVEVLKDVSLEAEPGQVIGLVGGSGSGKSTIVSLLQRFYDVTDSGEILIDGHKIDQLNVNWLRSIIGVVSQEPVLFTATIAENIRLGNLDLTDAELERLSKIANAHEFVSKFKDGYNTMIGDGNIQVSGGQKQRIAIARALARNPRILLLDEATSALDTHSERLIQDALNKNSNRTTIVIAHRLSTVRHCDKIFVFDKGEIIESGTHDELMEIDGIYSKLVKAQEIDQLDENGLDLRKEEMNGFEDGVRKRRSTDISQNEMKRELNKLESKQTDEDPASLRAIINFARKEWVMFGVAFIGGSLRGTAFPIFSLIYGQTFKILSIGTNQEKMDQSLHNLIYFGLLGVFSGIFAAISCYLFGAAGESLTRRLRLALFSNIVSQDGTYFDSPDHSPGKLSSILATDAPNIRAAMDTRFGDVIQSFSAIVCGIIIAFIYGPAMAPIGIITAGFLAVVQTIISQILRIRGRKDVKLAEEPSRLASEAFDRHRTIKSLGREKYFSAMFAQLNYKPHKRSVIRGVIQSLTYAFQSGYAFFNFAAAYRFGIFLVHKRISSPYTVFQVIETLNGAPMSMSVFAAYFPEYVRARLSAATILKMLQDRPTIKSPIIRHLDVKKLNSLPELHEVQIENVDFAYPINKDRKVLKHFTANISKGRTIALVGPSGCGKSTVIQLIERFYDPDSGTIRLGQENLKNLDLEYVRNRISLVSQEPILFNYSIKENIAYALKDATMSQIEEAARRANAHDFIIRLPKGYDTIVGIKGSLISGGQKQRISIARAIIKNPDILLLDEATSALDSKSEKLVQQALDETRAEWTSIVVAHRLSTIQHADLILVLKEGEIVEMGSHQTLLSMNGVYAMLSKEQGL